MLSPYFSIKPQHRHNWRYSFILYCDLDAIVSYLLSKSTLEYRIHIVLLALLVYSPTWPKKTLWCVIPKSTFFCLILENTLKYHLVLTTSISYVAAEISMPLHNLDNLSILSSSPKVLFISYSSHAAIRQHFLFISHQLYHGLSRFFSI